MQEIRFASRLKWSDNPKYWAPVYVDLPPGFNKRDQENYQKILTAIAGSYNDQPILRLEWGGNAKIKKYSSWNSISGVPTKEVEEPKFKLKVPSTLVPGEHILFPLRRWVITQLQTPEQGRVDDDRDAYFTNEFGLQNKVAEKEKYLYTSLIYVGDHYNCPKDCSKGKFCMGDYKDPGQAELNWLIEATFKLQYERVLNPLVPVTSEDLAKFKDYKQDKKKDTDIMSIIRDI